MLYKRSKILINKKFQLKFAFFVCSWIFALSMIYPLIIYNLFEYFFQFLQTHQNISAAPVDQIKEIQSQLLLLLGIIQLLFLLITFLLSLFLSHRIAGPLYKLKKSMEEFAKGNLDQKITFRKNDHFVELQDTFNDMVNSVNARKK
jgi:sensor histidine kinase YesM